MAFKWDAKERFNERKICARQLSGEICVVI